MTFNQGDSKIPISTGNGPFGQDRHQAEKYPTFEGVFSYHYHGQNKYKK